MNNPEQSYSYSIAWKLYAALRKMYVQGVEQLAGSAATMPTGINGYHSYGLSSYPLAVAAWEAFLNETCMSGRAKISFPNSTLWNIRNKADWWNIEDKTFLIPKLLLGETFDKSAQPYQDFLLLVRIRNHIVHFRPEVVPKKELKQLSQRCLTLGQTDHLWHLEIESTECLRWTINVICNMAGFLTSLSPHLSMLSTNFKVISDDEALSIFIATHGTQNTKNTSID